MADGHIALDGEDDRAVDGAHQGHVDDREKVRQEVYFDAGRVAVNEEGQRKEENRADDVDLKLEKERLKWRARKKRFSLEKVFNLTPVTSVTILLLEIAPSYMKQFLHFISTNCTLEILPCNIG